MRRVGKIGRRKVFSEVKNVNVESLKKRSKLLDFWKLREGVTKRRAGVTKRVTSYCHFLFYVSYVRNVRDVRYKRYVRFAPSASKFHSLHPRSKFHSFHSLLNFHSLHPRSKTKWKKVLTPKNCHLDSFSESKPKTRVKREGHLVIWK